MSKRTCSIDGCERSFYARERCKSHYHALTVGPRRRAKWERAVAMLGGRCAQCGSTEELQFDHIDPETKSFNIAYGLNLRWEALAAELELCQLLCWPCHLKKSADELAAEAIQNVASGFKRCSRCEAIKPLDQFWGSTQSRDGHRSACADCDREAQRRNRVRRRLLAEEGT